MAITVCFQMSEHWAPASNLGGVTARQPDGVGWRWASDPSAARSERKGRDFPRDPVVNTSRSEAGGAGSIPGCGAKITHDTHTHKTKQAML